MPYQNSTNSPVPINISSIFHQYFIVQKKKRPWNRTLPTATLYPLGTVPWGTCRASLSRPWRTPPPACVSSTRSPRWRGSPPAGRDLPPPRDTWGKPFLVNCCSCCFGWAFTNRGNVLVSNRLWIGWDATPSPCHWSCFFFCFFMIVVLPKYFQVWIDTYDGAGKQMPLISILSLNLFFYYFNYYFVFFRSPDIDFAVIRSSLYWFFRSKTINRCHW